MKAKNIVLLALLALVIAIGALLTGCGETEKALTLNPPGVENILYEDVITETILYENSTLTGD